MGYYLPPLPLLGCCVVSFDLYWQDNFLNNKIQSDKDNFLDNLIYEIAIMGVLGSIFRQDNFLTIYERFWHLGGHVGGVVVALRGTVGLTNSRRFGNRLEPETRYFLGNNLEKLWSDSSRW